MFEKLRNNIKWVLICFVICFVAAIPLAYLSMGQRGGDGSGPITQGSVVAKVNGKKIKFKDFNDAVVMAYRQVRPEDLTTEEDMLFFRYNVLQAMGERDLLIKDMAKRKIKPSKSEIDRNITAISSQFPTKEAFNDFLAQNGLTTNSLRDSVSFGMSLEILLKQITEDITVSEEEVKAFYDATKTFFFTVPTEYSFQEARLTDAAVANVLMQAIINESKPWDEALALVSSDLIIAASSEDKPYSSPVDDLEPSRLEMLRTMRDEEVRGPIYMAQNDFSVIMKVGSSGEMVQPLEEVRPLVEQQVREPKMTEAERKYYSNLYKDMDVKIMEPRLFPTPEQIEAAMARLRNRDNEILFGESEDIDFSMDDQETEEVIIVEEEAPNQDVEASGNEVQPEEAESKEAQPE